MKKAIYFLIFAFTIFIFSCNDFSNLEVPEKLSLKTDAAFDLPLGTTSISVKEKMGIDVLQDELADKISDAEYSPSVYDFNPGNIDDNVMTYIIDYPVLEQSITLQDNKGNDIDVNLEEVPIDPQPVEMPDFGEKIKETLSIPQQTLTVFEPGQDANGSDVELSLEEAKAKWSSCTQEINVTISPDFERMTLYDGDLKITIDPPAGVASSGFRLYIGVDLYSGGKKISSKAEDEYTSGGEIILPLEGDDRGFNSKMTLKVSGRVKGGTTGTERKYDVKIETQDFNIKSIEDISMTNDELGDYGKIKLEQSFALSTINESLESATIKQGYLKFFCKQPDGWSGINVDLSNSNFVVTGAISLSDENEDFDDTNKDSGTNYIMYRYADLVGKQITPGSVSTGGSYVSFSLEHANVTFPETGKKEINIEAECKIQEIDNLIVNLDKLQEIKDSKEIGMNFSTMLDDMLKGDFGDLIDDISFSGIEAYFFITQPTENEALQGLSIAGTVKASYKERNGTVHSEENGNLTPLIDTSVDGSETLKVKKTLAFDSYAENGVITAEKATLFNTDTYSGMVGSDTMDGLINSLPDDLVFLYDLNLKSDSADKKIRLTNADVDLVKSRAKIKVSMVLLLPLKIIFTDNKDLPEVGSRDKTITIADVMSLTKDESSEEDEDDNKDLLSFRGDDWDSDDIEKWTNYSKAVEKFALNYEVKNQLIVDETSKDPLDLKIYVDCFEEDGTTAKNLFYDADGKKISTKQLDLSGSSLSFTSDEITEILTNPPFNPKFRVEIPAGSSTKIIPRNAEFSITGTVQLKFDGSVPVELWSKD